MLKRSTDLSVTGTLRKIDPVSAFYEVSIGAFGWNRNPSSWNRYFWATFGHTSSSDHTCHCVFNPQCFKTHQDIKLSCDFRCLVGTGTFSLTLTQQKPSNPIHATVQAWKDGLLFQPNFGANKTNKHKTHTHTNIFLTALAGQSSQGWTRPIPKTNRIVCCEIKQKTAGLSRHRSQFVQGRVPFVPGMVPGYPGHRPAQNVYVCCFFSCPTTVLAEIVIE